MKRILSLRSYCASAKTVEKIGEGKLDFMQLHHVSKVPVQPVKEKFNPCNQEVEIDKRTVQLLERLALVNLDGQETLEALRSSIEFARRVENINTKGKKALYTVLDHQSLHLREDQVNDGNCKEKVLQNAKIIEEDYFVSPPGNIPLKQEENN